LEVLIGCCGFPTSKERYFKTFKLVEVQQTFYKLLDVSLLEKWRREAPEDFEFTVKAFQGITHPLSSPTWKRSGIKDLEKLQGKVGFMNPTKEVFSFWVHVLEECKALISNLILIQLPASFEEKEENLSNIDSFFSCIDRKNLNIAIEFRGWSEEKIKTVCEKHDLISCVDPFRNKPVHFSSKKILYFRLHGLGKKSMYNYSFSDNELLWLKEKLLEYQDKANKAYVLFNNKAMFENAKRFSEILKSNI